LPATVTVLIGVLCGLWLKLRTGATKRVAGLAIASASFLLIGLALNPVVPIAKKIWTDSFVFFSGGFALLVFAFAYVLCDVRGLKLWSYPLRVLGSNAILAFALSQLIGDYSDKPWPIRATGFAWLHSIIRICGAEPGLHYCDIGAAISPPHLCPRLETVLRNRAFESWAAHLQLACGRRRTHWHLRGLRSGVAYPSLG
jgi:hypothetical protein